MAFIEHKPTRNQSSINNTLNSVRITFKSRGDYKNSNSNTNLTVYIGNNVASKLGLKVGDKVSFYYDDTNLRKWLIKKSVNDTGYKLVGVKSRNSISSSMRFQMVWKVPGFKLNDNDVSMRNVKHDIHDGGILIFAD